MPSSKQPTQKRNSGEEIQYVYRGRKVEVRKDRDRAQDRERAQDQDRVRLFIDDHEMEMEQTESGVISHRFMFKEFGTPLELAEELIKQWGGAEHTHKPDPHD